MGSTYSVTQAQAELPSLLKRAEAGEPISIARRDETVAFVVSRERMEAIIETMNQLREQNNRAANETAIDY